MTDRNERTKITTYKQSFGNILGCDYTKGEIKNFIEKMETEGHTEKSISYAIWRSQDKLVHYRFGKNFLDVLKNEICKYSWGTSDSRWDRYWEKKLEKDKAKKMAYKLQEKQNEEAEKFKQEFPGYVYFTQGESGGAVKIGYTTNPESRLKTLQTSYPDILKILCLIPGDEKTEKEYHEKFKDIRLNGEWFKPTEEILKEIEELKIKYPQQVGD